MSDTKKEWWRGLPIEFQKDIEHENQNIN